LLATFSSNLFNGSNTENVASFVSTEYGY